MEANEATQIIKSASTPSCININTFSAEFLKIRGGRIGSGMGSLLEALWGYYINQTLEKITDSIEMAWFADHGYNDFACIRRNTHWDLESREGELFRIEVKSMNLGADESKGHFDEIVENLGRWDLLLVLVWRWTNIDDYRLYPHIQDHFIGSAPSVANLRDQLHIARGGSFVDPIHCPDGCLPNLCKHRGEPINASGKRERITGPKSLRVSDSVSHAANFGGLVRMLKTNSEQARNVIRAIRLSDDIAHDYISFIHRNYPNEEYNQYLNQEWLRLAQNLGIDISSKKMPLILEEIRQFPNYQNELRNLFGNI